MAMVVVAVSVARFGWKVFMSEVDAISRIHVSTRLASGFFNFHFASYF